MVLLGKDLVDGQILVQFRAAGPRNVTTTNYLWMASDPAFANNQTGPSGDHTTGTGVCICRGWFWSSLGTNQAVTNLITPPIDLSSDTVPRLVFYYHMFGSDVNWLNIRVRIVGFCILGSAFTVTINATTATRAVHFAEFTLGENM